MVNEIKSEENLSSPQIIALCESLLSRMEHPEVKQLRHTDSDRYYRSLKTQFKQLDDRYPGIFNMLTQYGRQAPGGIDTMAKLRSMLGVYDARQSGEITDEEADKAVDYDLAKKFVRPALGDSVFDNIVKDPTTQKK